MDGATTTFVMRGHVAYGQLVEPCDAHRAKAICHLHHVGTIAEKQWAREPHEATHDTAYCYSIYGGPQNLLGTDAPPVFHSAARTQLTAPLTFAVFGDWGQVDSTGAEPRPGERDGADRGERRADSP